MKLLDIIAVEYSSNLIKDYPEMCGFLVLKGQDTILDFIRDNGNGVLFAQNRITKLASYFMYDEVYLIIPKILKDIYTDLKVIKNDYDFQLPFGFIE